MNNKVIIKKATELRNRLARNLSELSTKYENSTVGTPERSDLWKAFCNCQRAMMALTRAIYNKETEKMTCLLREHGYEVG